MEFIKELKSNEDRLKQVASDVVKTALNLGVDECEIAIGGVKGLSVSSRDADVENIEFNKDNGMEITIYKNKKRGSASTTDLSKNALEECIKSAIAIAEHSDVDECAGICDKELICKDFKDLDLVFENSIDADAALDRAISLEKEVLNNKPKLIKNSDGASFATNLYTTVLANSHGFVSAKSSSFASSSITLLGQSGEKMQRGSGFSYARDINDLWSNEKIAQEAITKTLRKLDSQKVKTGKYNVIFSESAMLSLWSVLAGAISGGSLYRRSSFLCDKLGEQIFPEFVTVHEDPFIKKGLGSCNYDAEGVQASASDIILNGKLEQYLLATYSARKLGFKSNGHSGGIHNWFVSFGNDNTFEFDELLDRTGEGLVITDLMGQGVDMVSGNYSRGAEGYYFKDGKFVHAVDGITIAGNLKDMFSNMAAMSTKTDERYKIKSGDILIPNMTVSGI